MSLQALPVAAENTVVPATPSFLSLLQVLFSLGLVLAVIAAAAWLLRRLGPGQVSSASALRVVGGVAVGPKERVVVVDVGETRLVLGVAPGHVTTLHQMPRPENEPEPAVDADAASLFQQRLMTLLNRKGSSHAP